MKFLYLKKPTVDTLRLFLADQAARGYSYDAVGATATRAPEGFTVDRTRVLLGHGSGVFEAAKSALTTWQQFRLGWVDAWSEEGGFKPGQMVAIMGWAVGFWWLNSCRVIYTIDESEGEICRFGFAYGTLPGHVASGEERFSIEWDRTCDEVWYDVLAFSRPQHFLTRVGYPLVRLSQKRFGHESAAAIFRAAHACPVV